MGRLWTWRLYSNLGYGQARSRWNNPSTRPEVNWNQLARDTATAYCLGLSKGYNRAVNIRLVGPETFNYSVNSPLPGAPSSEAYRYRARKYQQWSATCQKTKRVRR